MTQLTLTDDQLEELEESLRVWSAQVRLLLTRGRRRSREGHSLEPYCRDLEQRLESVRLACRELAASPRDRVGGWVLTVEERWKGLRRAASRLSRELAAGAEARQRA